MSSLGDSIAYQLAHTHESRQGQLIAINVILISLSTVAVALRLLARRLKKAAWSYDEYLIILSEIFAYLLMTVNLICMLPPSPTCPVLQLISGPAIRYGLGMHLFALPVANIFSVLKTQYFFDIAYSFCIQLIKGSILLFYCRIFTLGSFRYFVYAIASFIVFGWISALAVAIFSCTPISHFWEVYGEGSCINIYAFIVAEAGLTIFTDLAILILPMPQVWRLKVSIKQKIGLSCIFLLGGFVCIASAIRLSVLHQLYTDDPTWTAYAPALWTLLEANLGIVCACLPIMRPLFVRVASLSLFSKVGSSRQSRQSSGADPVNRYPRQWSSKWSKKSKWSNTGTTLVSTIDEVASGPYQNVGEPLPKTNPEQVAWTADERWERDSILLDHLEARGREPSRKDDLESGGGNDRSNVEYHVDDNDHLSSKDPSSSGSLGLPLQSP
ncbi:MAG: hypothetical protein M1838_005545 [Thelocarpon superellum]|nr:MAG: hypothetical protein M1838_005545 [Thelocarpon superellum]